MKFCLSKTRIGQRLLLSLLLMVLVIAALLIAMEQSGGIQQLYLAISGLGQSDSTIPKLLHFASRSELLPAALAPLMNSCIALNPGWTVHLWTEADVRLLLLKEWPELLKLYSSGTVSQAERLAMAKYPVLHRFGGVFLDTTVECLKPLDIALEAANSVIFLALERPENHRILENAQFKLSPAAMGAAPGSAWFRHAIDVMQRRESIGQDLSLDGSFPTECHLLWQRKQQQRKQPGADRYQPERSVYLLPWEYFSSTLRNPDVMLGLCQQLRRWPELRAVYTTRSEACSSIVSNVTGEPNATAIRAGLQPNEYTVGLQHHGLIQSASVRLIAAQGRWKNQLLFNVTSVWPAVRRYEKASKTGVYWRTVEVYRL
ncbi:hypothetical protein BOX15_Mlig005522g1 [Macrostomum lignano]|uniref:Nucleotide-diphospho-sugar transferase domain-containing protein n=1 Tax=Macrostomum lignano TaxID=282301 RepID=A0A267DKE5_9PLAT|nr:hypothetical protein BOX15_Mlig005522g1 [Macrostomum lignano]